MEPLLWLLAPFAATALVAGVLARRATGRDVGDTHRVRRRQLQRIEAVLRPGDQRSGAR